MAAKKIQRRLPPFGKALIERRKFRNIPDSVFVFVGRDSWAEANRLQCRNDITALVLPAGIDPSSLIWPVRGCICIVAWDIGPGENVIIELAKTLLRSNAQCVVVWPRWVDPKSPIVEYDQTKPIGQRWVQVRESIRVYRSKEPAVVAA